MLRITAAVSLLAVRQAVAANTASRNKAIPKPACDPTITVSIRHSSESTGLYLESADGSTRGGCVTLQAIWEKMSSGAPLYPVDSATGNASTTATGTWLLTESLYVEDGITLQVTDTGRTVYYLFVPLHGMRVGPFVMRDGCCCRGMSVGVCGDLLYLPHR